MIKPIMKSTLFLQQPSAPATEADAALAQDLLDTLAAHAHECVGMAANMIGVRKRVIVFDNAGKPQVMFNPEIIQAVGEFQTKEGCLSLEGQRATKRFKRIRVRYDELLTSNGGSTSSASPAFRSREENFTGWTAQIIQHEIDHCNGIII